MKKLIMLSLIVTSAYVNDSFGMDQKKTKEEAQEAKQGGSTARRSLAQPLQLALAQPVSQMQQGGSIGYGLGAQPAQLAAEQPQYSSADIMQFYQDLEESLNDAIDCFNESASVYDNAADNALRHAGIAQGLAQSILNARKGIVATEELNKKHAEIWPTVKIINTQIQKRTKLYSQNGNLAKQALDTEKSKQKPNKAEIERLEGIRRQNALFLKRIDDRIEPSFMN